MPRAAPNLNIALRCAMLQSGPKNPSTIPRRLKLVFIRVLKNSLYRLVKKTSEARRAKIDERRTLLYVDAKSVERTLRQNSGLSAKAYESFSTACSCLANLAYRGKADKILLPIKKPLRTMLGNRVGYS